MTEESVDDIWQPLDYDEAWKPFNERFEFRPSSYERIEPAIGPLDAALVVDLEPVFGHAGARFAAGEAAVNLSALRAFVWLAKDQDLTALDWQHTPCRYSPGRHALSTPQDWPIPVFPNGDYFIHFPADLRWGTFGHPWQRTLTLWGDDLVHSLGAELLTWLPRHPQSVL